jgi:hypothetical protein
MATVQPSPENGKPPRSRNRPSTLKGQALEEKLAKIQQTVETELLIWDEDMPPQEKALERYVPCGPASVPCSRLQVPHDRH